jgi:hypothetical protein
VATSARPSPVFARVGGYFHRHPIVLFLAFTPGIPEYLSGSTRTAGLFLAPPVFLIFLGLNLGLYGPGALLVREALVRWRKGWGWATLLVLGAAYALLEEGTALSTLFNPTDGVVGSYGTYGHAYGVNWIWTLGILEVHVLFSISLPILLLGLALPETRGRSLLGPRGIATALGLYAVDIALLILVANYWRVDAPYLVAAAAIAGLLWLVASRLPRGVLDPSAERPRHGPRVAFLLGLAAFPMFLVVPALLAAARAPALVTGLVVLALGVAWFLAVRAELGRAENRAQLTAFALGALLPLAVVGFFANLVAPAEIVVDALFGLLFYVLWKRYRPAPAVPRVPTPA